MPYEILGIETSIAQIKNTGLPSLQSTKYLLELGKFHRLSGIPNDYFGVMGTIFVHAVRPYWEEAGCMSEETEDVWMMLFAHIARVMTHGHKYLHGQHLVRR